MNAKKIEKWILLEQTGELSPRRKKILDACPDAQAKRDELNAIFSAVNVTDVEPSPWAVTRINARLRSERRSILLPTRIWQPILALAACLTLVVTTFDFQSDSPSVAAAASSVVATDEWSVRFEEDLAELEGLILAMSDTPLYITEM